MTRHSSYKRRANPLDGHYKDTGCEWAPSCLNCPFFKCLEDGGGSRHFLKEKRDAEIRKLWGEGKSKKELASIFGLSIKTIQKIVGDYNYD